MLTVQFVILSIITAISTYARAYSYNILGEKITFDLRNNLFKSLVSKDIEFFD